MQLYKIIGLAAVSVTLFAMHPARRETPVGHTWEYRGSVTVENTDNAKPFQNDLLLTATQADTLSGDRSLILRFRAALRPTEPGSAPPLASVAWIETPGRYTGHLPAPHSMTYGMEMADALPLPRPFRTAVKPDETRTVGLPLFSLQGDLVPLRQQVTGVETVAAHSCYRVERTTTRNQPVGMGTMLETYKETLWVDTTDGTLVKYQGKAKLAAPNSVMQIATVFQLTRVQPVEAQEWAQREQQVRLLMEVLYTLDANPFPGRAQAAEMEQAQQQLATFNTLSSASPYQAACNALQEELLRTTKILEHDQLQASLVDKAAPAFVLRDLNGKTRRVEEFHGHVVLLNFFASWCSPCNEEAPQIETEFWQKWRGQGLVVLGIDGRDGEDGPAKARGFGERHHLTYPLLVDSEGKATSAYHVQAIPVNVVIDKEGVVRYIATGFDPDAIKGVLNSLLTP